ncbi:class I SAM-dependent methyltransferase [Sinorhizobium sp. BG8]|uniref:class I SAM-dependent methyltransferase n=1 Tax=Sinorhizobium sp. BG8 TaxID=2613773 RepID=UPI00193E4384|nr:class I SAM-dependent methyltransferase [Sinorhizobium sp. BG8]QRM56221.1 class I SAM-dependent methyltransferase [Sinorhizobium sp. BG8]
MKSAGSKAHWEGVYATKAEQDVSWFQPSPTLSLELIAGLGPAADTGVIDIGGGASRLVDELLAKGFETIAVLDLSEKALAVAKARLGGPAARVRWINADVTTWQPSGTYDIWHDRAALHFLTDERDQEAYVSRLRQTVKIGGHAIIATFAPDGPEKCSGLPVLRHSPESLAAMLGDDFTLIESRHLEHCTPWGTKQSFQYSLFRHDA